MFWPFYAIFISVLHISRATNRHLQEAMATVNMHKKLGKVSTCVFEICERPNELIAMLRTTMGALHKIWKSYSIPISMKIRLVKALAWPVATYGCESWTLRKNEETRPDASEMKGLRKIMWFSWTA